MITHDKKSDKQIVFRIFINFNEFNHKNEIDIFFVRKNQNILNQ